MVLLTGYPLKTPFVRYLIDANNNNASHLWSVRVITCKQLATNN